jgi:EmrB/QacA subfamily drug resistance transporter
MTFMEPAQAQQIDPAQLRPAGHSCPAARRKYVLIVAILASALGLIDTTVVAIALPKIRASLDASFVQIQWVGSGYVLFLAALMLLGGVAADRYGVRRTFAVGITGFVIASLTCAIAPDAATLIAARCVKGAMAAIMVPSSLAIIAKNYPRAKRGRAIGTWAAASSITMAFGPVIGGWMLSWGNDEFWRWIFAINLPLGVIALTMLLLVPADKGDSSRPLDWKGAALITLSLTALALGLTLSGDGGARVAVYTTWLGGAGGLVLIALVLGAVWIIMERRLAAPLVNLNLFASRAFSGANVATLLIYTALSATLFFLPMLMVSGWGLTELYAGGIFLPFSLLIAGLSPLAGRWSDAHGPRGLLTVGPVISAVGLATIGLAAPHQEFWFGVVPGIGLLGIGMGLTISPLSTAVIQAVKGSETGAASGINNTVSRMASLVAIVGFGAVIAALFASAVRRAGLPFDLGEALVAAGFGERLEGALYQVRLVEVQGAAMNEAFLWTTMLAAMLCVVAGLAGFFTQQTELT